MKNSILILLLTGLLALLTFQSCRKPEKPRDPCKNAVTVTALGPNSQQLGHFSREYSGGTEYLYAVNYHEYASRITEGRKYKLAYREEPCFTNKTQGSNIREGGCVVYEKCIRITCLKEMPDEGCFGSVLDEENFQHYFGQGFTDPSIQGNTLQVTSWFSGCSIDDPIDFQLVLSPLMMRCPPGGPQIFLGKIRDMRNGYTCQAYFGKKTCYDLNSIRTWFGKNNMALPEKVILRLEHGQETTDLEYRLN